MSVILTISVRNLLRQKRRNILLGTAIAFGTMILVLASAFSKGISDTIFNKIVSYVSGHVSVAFSENGNAMKSIFRDGDRMRAIIRETVPDATLVSEAIGVFTRAIGNGKADNIIMVGMDVDAEVDSTSPDRNVRDAEQNFRMIQGAFQDIKDTTVENAVLLAEQKAKSLNVKMGDVIRVRFRDMNNQDQAAKLTVVGIFKPANMFMAMPVFLHVHTLRRMLGYGPHDVAQLNINIKNPKRDAIRLADSLYQRLQPPLAVIGGSGVVRGAGAGVSVLGFKGDSVSQARLRESLPLAAGDTAAAFGKEGVVLSAALAQSLAAGVGDTCVVSYRPKYGPDSVRMNLVVSAVAAPGAPIGPSAILVRDNLFFKHFLANWPAPAAGAWLPDSANPLHGAVSTEWILLKRAKTTQEMVQQFRNVAKLKQKGCAVDVRTMYESASQVLQMEVALNLITFVAVMVLFFIILIGVVNTLRMTVRERTREIGTVRAIGMQRNDVRNSFMLETGMLALFAALVGTIAAYAAMALLSLWTIDPGENPMGMLLVNNHLHFVPTASAAAGYVLLIVGIAVATAFFPARKAAKLSAASALRHYE